MSEFKSFTLKGFSPGFVLPKGHIQLEIFTAKKEKVADENGEITFTEEDVLRDSGYDNQEKVYKNIKEMASLRNHKLNLYEKDPDSPFYWGY
jgi:hypothetical protein